MIYKKQNAVHETYQSLPAGKRVAIAQMCKRYAQSMTKEDAFNAIQMDCRDNPQFVYEAIYLLRAMAEVHKSGYEYTLNNF